MDLDFPTTEKYTKDDVKRLQYRLLEMAKVTSEILDGYHIKYMITFGTLLGAVRHEGFIPWDDDLDFYIFDDEYDRAIEVLNKELPNDIIVHNESTDPIYWPAWSRLRDLRSSTRATLFPDDNLYKYTGINLDLYRLKKVDRNLIELYRCRENIGFYKRKVKNDIIKYSEVSTRLKELEEKAKELEQTPLCGENVYTFVILTEALKETDVFPLKKYKFEDTEFWGPQNADELLKQAYGNYMDIPSYKNRKTHYDYVEFLGDKVK